MISDQIKLCKCGCGEEVTKDGNLYINGHHSRGKKLPLTTRKKMSTSATNKFIENPHLREKCAYRHFTFNYLKSNYPFLFDTELIKNENNKILVNCKNCKNWFEPSYTQIYERIRSLRKPIKNIHNYFYCSNTCKKSCRYYNRHIDIDNYDLNKLYEYQKIVSSETEKTIRKYKDKIKNIELRGKKFGYEVDHKFSVVEGFKNKVDPLIISNWRNLEVITEKENSIKKEKCSITINELLNLIEMKDK